MDDQRAAVHDPRHDARVQLLVLGRDVLQVQRVVSVPAVREAHDAVAHRAVRVQRDDDDDEHALAQVGVFPGQRAGEAGQGGGREADVMTLRGSAGGKVLLEKGRFMIESRISFRTYIA